MKRYVFLPVFIGLIAGVLYAESTKVKTQYPSPLGAFSKLRVPGESFLAFTTGNVGVGTTTPGSKLDVRGHVAAYSSAGSFVQLWSDNALIWGNAAFSGSLRFGNASGQAAGSWSEKMRITGNGRVGIGTTNPSYTLHVQGTFGGAFDGTNVGPFMVSYQSGAYYAVYAP